MKYNWNNDKGTHEVFGFSEGDESWEVKSNTSQLSKFHTATFPANWNGEDYEPRYPDDYEDNTKLKAMTEFIYSTWQDEATGDALDEPVTYNGVQYTNDTAAYRLAKFKDGYPQLYDLDNATFFYVFTFVFLLADDRQKNEFLTYWHETGKWWELPYDFDTALGTDNRGNLTFEYWMEDTDQFNGEYVFNGADNVKWVNFRQAFWDECKAMYQRMRSTGMLNTEYIKNYFRNWQSAWPTQIWNEDGDYKYVKPLRDSGTTTYLTMAYGSKRWQREEFYDWRIPYIDSMFDVSDALLSIMFRPFYQVTETERARGDVDIQVDVYKKSYVTVLWDATKVSHRVIDETYTCNVENPLAFANDAVCAIHNAKMIKDVHGLEKLNVGFWDSTNAPNLQAIRLGSNAAGYQNTATKTVSVGANRKLTLVDLRNCVNFGTDDQKTLDLAHCPNIREVYLDGTSCMGVDLPNGGYLEVLHLPATTTSIVLRNQTKLTDTGLSVASYNSIDQLWLENMTGVDTLSILRSVPAGTAVRITGFYWEAEDAEEIEGIFDLFDTMNGININGEEVATAQLSGTIHTTALRGDDIASWNERYPTVTVSADSVASYLYYKTWDGSQTLKTVTCVDGVPQDTTAPAGPARADTERFRYTFVGWNTQQDASTAETGYLDDVLADRNVYAAYSRVALTYLAYKTWDDATLIKTVTCVDGVPEESSPSGPTRTSTAQYDYSFVGWNLSQDAQTADASCITNVSADRTVYAAYSRTVRQYTVTWMNAGNTTIATETYDYGDTPSFKGTTPTYQGQTSTGWLPAISAVTGNITYTAQYKPMYTATFVRASADGGGTLYTQQNVVEGTAPVYGGATPTTTQGTAEDYPFEGWTPALAPIYANTTYTAQFGSPIQDTEITDSWDTIIANIDNGSYKTAYKIGNYKPLDLGTEGTVNMQIVAMDEDELASGGTAPLTFIAKELLATRRIYDSTGTTWNDSELRNILYTTIQPLIPSNVYSRINTVNKNTRIDVQNGRSIDAVFNDKLWIPSQREVIYSEGNIAIEQNGAKYNKIYVYPSNENLIKNDTTGNPTPWWLRSFTNPNYKNQYRASSSGRIEGSGPRSESGVCLGFCLGLEPETITDSWSEIFAAEQDGTYSTKYSIGDTKMIDLGTEGQHLMEIVAFDTDDKADGSGKAKITWISKDLLNTKHKMNASKKTVDGETAYTAGGWEHSDMRAYLKDTVKPLIPETVRNAIVPVTKVSSTYTGGALVVNGQTTTDDVWIPSNHEVGLGTDRESTGAVYSGKFTNNSSRTKKLKIFSEYWWLRSASNDNGFGYVYVNGYSYDNRADGNNCVALGFCTSAPNNYPDATTADGAYGVEWDYSNSSPALTRKGLAASFADPVPATDLTTTGTSPFDNIAPWSGMKRYCIINGEYVPDTDSRFDEATYDTVVWIPEFYYTAYKDTTNSKWLWAISPTEITGYKKHPGSGRYIGRYHTGGSSSGVYSKSGVTPLVSTSQTDFRTYSTSKGTGWRMMDLATWSALQMLYLVEFANFDSQTTLGKGWSTGSIVAMGGTDSATYHTVKVTGAHNQYRWVEDPFSNCFDWIDGFMGSQSKTYAAANSSYAGGSSDLNELGFALPSSGAIHGFGYSKSTAWAFIADTASGSDYTTYACDRVNSNSSLCPAYVGGFYTDSGFYGFFFFGAGNSAPFTNGNLGSRLILDDDAPTQ